ncbi:hypothetical protein JK358_35575 [Nocardia sp. 2]|uniref:Uncharacterized protein n=1 Tax=Nocardia acididurans TaxID=2802282 RepID=A0ABS1MI67_9NOCA|nr:hypothetical protein [Nocardia acididurans]MBL1079735.1 hypothetical protein [Nocardia acididurans]
MTGTGATPRRLDGPDMGVLNITWSPGTVHLRLDREQVLDLSLEAAAWLAVQDRVCLHAALERDPTAANGGFVRELLTGTPRPLTDAEFQALTGPDGAEDTRDGR